MGADGAGRCKQTVAIEEARSLCSLAGPSARDKGPTHGAPCWGREGRSKGSDLTTLQCTHPASDPNPRAASPPPRPYHPQTLRTGPDPDRCLKWLHDEQMRRGRKRGKYRGDMERGGTT
ncbi:hypothetical protein J4Q44_G00273250 [Coregonus suidteri]|uniref:Uncharacterized protein n=1 Tax=Coregonus suidteri TaxID=861788 RepID=A0AAN8L6V6_9TELE